MSKLPFSEVLVIKDMYDYLESGQSIRVNHDSPDCDGSSNSMIVERKDDGNLSIYCFRCGRRGFYGSGITLKSKEAREGCNTTQANDYKLSPKSLPEGDSRVESWPPEARAWIRRGRITDEEVLRYGIIYSPVIRRVIIPWYDDNGNLCHYQTRKIHDEDTGPKYLSYWNSRDPVILGGSRVGNRMVFVEDYLSGMRIARYCPVTVLLGVNLLEQHILFMVEHGYTEFLVWLDDDRFQVRTAQLNIKRTLDKIGKCLIYHGKGVDPKELTDTQIQQLLEDWRHGKL